MQKYFNFLGLLFCILIVFVFGFYFGYKNSEAKLIKNNQNSTNLSKLIEAGAEESTSVSSVELKPLESVHWIKVGTNPVCPSTHPIKAKLDNDVKIYYTSDYKSYDRIIPHLCFATENFAKDEAGFVKKY